MEEHNYENERNPEEKINPWLAIFFRPKVTMRWLLRRETAGSARMLWLSFTALAVVILFVALMFYPNVAERPALKMRLVIVTPFIFALSYLYFVVESYLLSKVSGWLGGRGDTSAMRIVNAFTTVIPGIILGFLNIAVALVLGKESPLYILVENVILIWTAYITACGIGVAAGFAPWKGLLVYVITMLLWLAAIGAGAAFWLQVLPRLG